MLKLVITREDKLQMMKMKQKTWRLDMTHIVKRLLNGFVLVLVMAARVAVMRKQEAVEMVPVMVLEQLQTSMRTITLITFPGWWEDSLPVNRIG